MPAGAALAASAFEEAGRQGQPQVPLIRGRDLTESLLALAVETGLPAARAVTASLLPTGRRCSAASSSRAAAGY